MRFILSTTPFVVGLGSFVVRCWRFFVRLLAADFLEAHQAFVLRLEAIVAHGKEAEALNQSQGALTRDKSAASARTQEAFAVVQRGYAAVMNVVAALPTACEKAAA